MDIFNPSTEEAGGSLLGQPSLQSEVEDIQGHTEKKKFCLKYVSEYV